MINRIAIKTAVIVKAATFGLACFALQTCFAEPTPAALYVDSKAIKERFNSITAEDMEMLRGKKIILNSRSYWFCMRDGILLLAKEDKKYDLLKSYEHFDVFSKGGDVGIIPPDIFSKANFVQFLATYYPLTKREDEMDKVLREAPHNFGKVVDAVVIINSIGWPTIFDYYAEKMDAIQTDFPKIRVIYATAGCKGPPSDSKVNEDSHAFSEKVRERYMGKVPLYDMEKIMCDDFRCGHAWCPEYSKDKPEGHPNTPAGEIMLAKGFLLVLRDAFRHEPCSVAELPKITGAAKPKVETLPANHPDMQAVRAILDANGLTKKTVEGVSVIEGGRITKLYLQECGITELPDIIGKLDALKLLHLYGDRKQPYPLLKKISPAIGNCTKLESLLINQNDLETLPVEIAKLEMIKSLSLTDNRFKNLPAEVVKWAMRFDPQGLDKQNLPAQ